MTHDIHTNIFHHNNFIYAIVVIFLGLRIRRAYFSIFENKYNSAMPLIIFPPTPGYSI